MPSQKPKTVKAVKTPAGLISFARFRREHLVMASTQLDNLAAEDKIEITEEDESSLDERLEALLNQESWTEDEQVELSSLFFCLAYVSRVSEDEEDEEGEGDEDEL